MAYSAVEYSDKWAPGVVSAAFWTGWHAESCICLRYYATKLFKIVNDVSVSKCPL